MKIVGLVGENPNDTIAIANLLSQRYSGDVAFVSMLKELRGDMLDSPKVKHLVRKEYERNRPDLVLMIQDLDALEDDKVQMAKRKGKFREFNNIVNGKGILLLNIYELEALIFADFQTYNLIANANIPEFPDPMHIPMPKEELRKHGHYTEFQTREIFAKLRIDIVAANCRYFQEFLLEFEKRIA